MLKTILLVSIALCKSASAECSRTMLKDATTKYVAAQTSGQTNGIVSLTSNVNYTENELPVDITKGVLTQPVKIDHSRSILDTVNCATFTEILAATNDHPYVIGTRMLFTNDKITTIESIVTDDGDWAFNATGYLYWNSLEKWDPIPEDKRDSRAVIQAAGDAYFDRFKNISAVVPWGTPCARLEGGAYTGGRNLSANTCNLGLPSTLVVTNRRYVVDEEMGVVVIYVGFPGLDRSQGQTPMPDSHMFRVEEGELRYIHTISSCVQAGCGLGGGPPPTLRL